MRRTISPIGIALGFLAFLCVSAARAQTPAPPLDLATADWSVKQAKILNAKPIGTIWKSLNNVPGWSDLGPDVGKLCAFQFADLRHSGELSLVVSYDNGGTADCNMVDVLDKTPGGLEDYDFNNDAESDFDSIDDINGDGHPALIIDEVFAAGSQSGHCTATWPVIYAWTGNGYSDVSRHYRKYYEQQLTGSDPLLAEPDVQDCDKAISAKFERFLDGHVADRTILGELLTPDYASPLAK
jgi:hypothetical protein